MKKNYFILALISGALAFFSCSDNDDPDILDKKVTKITRTGTGVDGTETMSFTYNSSDKITAITDYDGNKETYSYYTNYMTVSNNSSSSLDTIVLKSDKAEKKVSYNTEKTIKYETEYSYTNNNNLSRISTYNFDRNTSGAYERDDESNVFSTFSWNNGNITSIAYTAPNLTQTIGVTSNNDDVLNNSNVDLMANICLDAVGIMDKGFGKLSALEIIGHRSNKMPNRITYSASSGVSGTQSYEFTYNVNAIGYLTSVVITHNGATYRTYSVSYEN